jgi:outer membrane protein TolC
MKTAFSLAAFFVAGSAFSLAVHAQQPVVAVGPALPTDVSAKTTLAGAIDAAWQRAVLSRQMDGQRRIAESGRASADRLWASPPSIDFSRRDDRLQSNAGSRETGFGVTWPLWLPGQKDAQKAVAQAAVDRSELAMRAARLRIAGEVREAAWAVIAIQAELALVNSHAETLRRLADDVEKRVQAGDLARVDAMAAKAEVLAASAQQSDVQQRLQSVRSRWTVLTGEAVPALDALAEKADSSASLPSAMHPELQVAIQAIEEARRRLELTRVATRDAPELTVGVRQDVAGNSDRAQNSLVVGIRLPFGTSDRNQPLQAAAISDLEVAQTTELRLRERIEADVATARAALMAAERQLAFEQGRTQLLKERAALLDRSFRAGETALSDLLRALSVAAQSEGAAARQAAATGLERARLNQSIGLIP